MSNIEDLKPIDCLATRVWSGTHYHYPHIEKMIADLRQLRARVQVLEQAIAAAIPPLERCGLIAVSDALIAALNPPAPPKQETKS